MLLFSYRYCPKRLRFGYDGYNMRNQLAVLDHNYHVNREVATNFKGEPIVLCQESRRTKEWVAYPKLSAKSYNYIPGESLYLVISKY